MLKYYDFLMSVQVKAIKLQCTGVKQILVVEILKGHSGSRKH